MKPGQIVTHRYAHDYDGTVTALGERAKYFQWVTVNWDTPPASKLPATGARRKPAALVPDFELREVR